MARLSSQLVISLVDRVTSPARALAGSMKLLQGAAAMPGRTLRNEGRRFAAAGQRFSSGVATPLGLGAAAIVASSNEFEKAFLGSQIAGIADNLKDGVVQMGKLRAEATKARQQVFEISDAMGVSPTGLMQAMEAVGKMGLPEANRKRLVEMAGSLHIQDPDVSPQSAAEFLGGIGINYKAGKKEFDRGTGTGDYNKDVTRLANQLAAIANMTKTSVGRMQEGLRQFAPLYADLGVTFSETSALLGGMVQAGLDEVSSGTALKSLGTRMLKPTAEGREAMLLAGLDRSKYMSLEAIGAGKASQNITRMSGGAMTADKRKKLDKFLREAEKSGATKSDTWQAELTAKYNQLTRAKDAPTKDRNADMIEMAAFTAGGKIDMFSLFKDLAAMQGKLKPGDEETVLAGLGLDEAGADALEKVQNKLAKGELTAAQMATIGEGRHLNRYTALLSMMPEVIRYQAELNKLNSEFTDAGNALYKEGAYGQRMAALASLSSGLIKLGASDGFTQLIAGFGRFANYIANLSPDTIENLGYALAGLIVLAPVGAAMAGIAATIGLVAAAARLAIIPVVALLARLTGIGRAATAAGPALSGAGMAGLFGAGAAGAAAVKSTKIGKTVATGMGAAGAAAVTKAASAGLIKGMTASGVAGGAAKGGGMLARVAGVGAKGMGRLFLPLGIGLAAWDAYQGYQKDGLKGAILNPLTLGLYSGGDAKAAGAPLAGTPPAGPLAPRGAPLAGTPTAGPRAGAAAGPSEMTTAQGEAQRIASVVQNAMAQVRAAVAAVDLTAEGKRIGESLANGLRQAVPSIQAAGSQAAAAASRSALRGSFTDGGR